MKIDVSAEVGFQSGLESITADRCRAELGRQWVPHSRGSHVETPCSQLRPHSRNEQVAALSRTKTGPGSVVRHGNTDAREIRRPHAPNTVKSQQSNLELSSLGDRQVHNQTRRDSAIDPGTVVVRRRRRRQGLGPTPVVKLTIPNR